MPDYSNQQQQQRGSEVTPREFTPKEREFEASPRIFRLTNIAYTHANNTDLRPTLCSQSWSYLCQSVSHLRILSHFCSVSHDS